VELGGVRIVYVGHATFQITTPGGKNIIIDPWLQENPACPEEFKDVQDVDFLLITHGHFDHLGDAVPLAQRTGATTVSNFEIYSYITGKGVENAVPVQKGGTADLGDFKVTAVNAFHSSSIAGEDGSIIYGGEPLGYVLEFESGFKLYHAGDTGIFGDMRLIGELYAPDLALLPIGNQVVMSPYEAAHATRLLGVKNVVPMHYGTFPFLPGTPEEYRQAASDISGLNVYVLEPGQGLDPTVKTP
jgi:L-ascorbate metabolism protein UlaG (beta-lactamase superfamily)